MSNLRTSASLQSSINNPDAAKAKKLLAELEAAVLELAPATAAARAGLARVFGEGRDMQVTPASYPVAPLRSEITPLARWFFPEAFRLVGELRKAAADAKVIAAQVRELPDKL